MLAAERRQLILKTLRLEKFVPVSDLSKLLDVTEETARRDLDKLVDEGLVLRVHGGAHLKEGYGDFTPINLRKMMFWEEKQRIAARCASLAAEGETVLLDCSTTAFCIAQALKAAVHGLTVITNSLSIAGELAGTEGMRLVLLGGEFSPHLNAFGGDAAVRQLEWYSADRAFISGAGINAATGLCDFDAGESAIRRKMTERAAHCYFAADDTKIGRNAAYSTAPLECLDGLVVAQPLGAKGAALEKRLKSLGVDILLGIDEGTAPGSGHERTGT